MLIDLFTSCATITKCSYYDIASTNIFTDNYTIKNSMDIKSVKITSAVSAMELTFLVPESKMLKDVIYDMKGYTGNVQILTSIDYINWYELPYKTDDKYIYKEVSPGIFYCLNDKYVYKQLSALELYNLTLQENITLNSELHYIFSTVGDYTKELTYLYDEMEFKFLKFKIIENINASEVNPFYFTNFEILIEEPNSISLDNNLLEIKAGMYTKPKIYQEEEFLPDMIKNYLKLIEEKNSTLSNLNFVSIAMNTDSIVFSPEEGIGDDFVEIDTVVY